MSEDIINKGTGAGGMNTNVNGKAFEEKTNSENRLLSNGFVRKVIDVRKQGKYNYYLELNTSSKKIVYLTQNGLKLYFDSFFSKTMCRCPDEAYLIIDSILPPTLKILEKKSQSKEGSVEDKLGLGHYMKSEYQYCLGNTFKVEYAFLLCPFLAQKYKSEEKKFQHIRQFNEQNGIKVFFGDNYEDVYKWIYQ
jgi:hypothetical protein